jgi:LacI family transcriptional regulator
MAGGKKIRDVALAAGVSIGTASRVLNGHTNVAPEIRDRVLAIVNSIGYRPNIIARSMRSGRTKTIAVLVRDMSIPLFAEFLSALEGSLSAQGYSIFVAATHDDPELELKLLDTAQERRVDGVIMTTANEHDTALTKRRAAMDVPVILLDRDPPEDSLRLLVDHSSGIKLATESLISLGHKDIGLITGNEHVYPGRARVEGYCLALAEAGLSVRPELIHAHSFDAAHAQASLVSLLELQNRPSALIIGSSSLLPAVLRTLARLGLKVPSDISLVAGSDSDLAELGNPQISVLQWSYRDLGTVAATLLLAALNGEPAALSRHVSPSTYIPRSSCAPFGT